VVKRDLLEQCFKARAQGREFTDEEIVFLLSERTRIIKELRIAGAHWYAAQIERGEHWEE
jgi:hypothetical protein